ncbi:MAG: ribosome small subunit-dependent GTPase A, partial [Planctomycetota bacterium]
DADGRVVPTTGETYECTVRRVLRTLARDGRNAVVTGDHVLVRVTAPAQGDDPPQAVIERVEPRRGVISRLHHNREHVIAANVDQAAIVTAAADPPLKPGLIDRFVASCERNRVRPLIVINKVDLVPRDRRGGLAEIALRYHRLGYPVVPASVPDGRGVDRLRRLLAGRVTVFSGQSGVGKSSLLNAVHDGLGLKTSEVSGVTGKGTHTTRRAVAMPLPPDARVIDTPGIRQFDLWGEDAGELEAYFVEFRPFIPHCRFPDCTHTHETGCAVKQAVEDGLIAKPRYESYVRMFEGDD